MQFRVVGENSTADSLRALLRRAQLPLVSSAAALPTTAAFTIEIVEQDGPVVVDSVDSELDKLLREQIQELLAYDIAVRHKTGEVRSDNLIRIEVASGGEDSEAIVTGVRRAIDLFINGPALQRSPVRLSRLSPSQRALLYLMIIVLGLLLFFGGYVLSAVAQTQTNVQRLGGTTVPAGVVDTPNAAIKVNCIIGCGASGGLTNSELRATPVPVSGAFWQATQPVSGVFWQTIQPVSGTVSVGNIPHVIIDSMPAGGAGLTDLELRASPVPVSGTFFQATQPVSGAFFQATQPVSGAFFQATQPVSIASMPSTPVTGTFWQATQPVSGPLTDAQLRASAVPVSGPLTDAQLRASAVPVSVSNTPTVAISQTTTANDVDATIVGTPNVAVTNTPNVSVTNTPTVAISQTAAANDVDATIVGTVPVSGPLTDAQLRAAAVPVSGPLTDTQLRATAVPVSGPLTDGQLRATPVPVSGTVSSNATIVGTPAVTTKTALTANSPATASVGVASAQAVASNASRKGLVIINLSNATVCFGIGATAVLNSGICLQPSAAWTMNEYSFATGAINAIAAAAASTISIQEFQ